jgi:alkylated DNA repair dioxygenase AlkB
VVIAPTLFEPGGLRHRYDFITPDEELALLRVIPKLPFKEYEFQSYLAKRRVVSYGWSYNYGTQSLEPAAAMPQFLLELRELAADFAGIDCHELVHALVTEYAPGTPIGWHRDRPVFDKVIGISLLSSCTFRFRLKSGTRWERFSLILEPRSVYLLSGEIRELWEHSIPEVKEQRYSITFRSLRKR